MRCRLAVAAAVSGALAAGYLLAGRAWQLTWGATALERAEVLPGDDLLAVADVAATRAITIRAAPGAVWPWIAQLGQGRGGFYSYDLVENLIGCDIHSAGEIVPHWQDVQVGDEVRLAPRLGLAVVEVEPGRALVLSSAAPGGLGGADPGPPPFPYDFTWAFVVRSGPGGVSRLIVRERYRYLRPVARFMAEPVEVVSFVMSRKMLRGIRDRAERAASAT
ncbi:MAG: hypothetical protein ACYCPF_21145 [Streptosporangiaceae bacterium]